MAGVKPSTGRTVSLNPRTVGLPENTKWQDLKNFCSKENLTAAGVLAGQPNHSSSTPEVLTPVDLGHPAMLHPIFGTLSPIVSGRPYSPSGIGTAVEVQHVGAQESNKASQFLYRNTSRGLSPSYTSQITDKLLRLHNPAEILSKLTTVMKV